MRYVTRLATTEEIQSTLAELKRVAPVIAQHAKVETLIDGLNAQIRVLDRVMTLSDIQDYFTRGDPSAYFQYWMAIGAREWIDGTSKDNDLAAPWLDIEKEIIQRLSKG